MDELVRWLREQLDKDTTLAKRAANMKLDLPSDAPWERARLLIEQGRAAADEQHIAEHDPARVLREIEADRELLAEYERLVRAHEAHQKEADRLNEAGDDDPFRTAALRREADYLPAMLHVLEGWAKRKAAVYRGRPGYRAEEWAP
jgi:hypothetical protein